MKETIIIIIMSAFITILAIWLVKLVPVEQCDTGARLDMLEHQVAALQELQQEKLNAFSNDVHNMTGVMELLEKQAEILQEIERRTK